MRRFLSLLAAVTVLFVAQGCKRYSGVCDCCTGPNGCPGCGDPYVTNSSPPSSQPPLIKPEVIKPMPREK